MRDIPKEIRVHSIDQERWYIERNLCTCGGEHLSYLGQALMRGENGPVDEVSVCCSACQKTQSFRFDIAACAPHLDPLRTLKMEQYQKVMPQAEAHAALMLCDMDRALLLIKELEDSNEAEGIEFILDRAKSALARLRKKTRDIEPKEA